MSNPFIILGLLLAMSAMAAFSAFADNANVENAITSRPDLSSFYRLFVDTGVNHELSPDTSYTVFAPTNEAFALIRQDHYPCVYTRECQAQVAEIIRNHIIPGKVHIDHVVTHEGGFFSLGGRFVRIGEPSRDKYAVDGNQVVFMSSFGGGMLYKIEGIIASPQEWVSLHDAQYTAASTKEVTTVAKTTIPDPSCGPFGCPDELTETTTITHVVTDQDQYTAAPLLAPTR